MKDQTARARIEELKDALWGYKAGDGNRLVGGGQLGAMRVRLEQLEKRLERLEPVPPEDIEKAKEILRREGYEVED